MPKPAPFPPEWRYDSTCAVCGAKLPYPGRYNIHRSYACAECRPLLKRVRERERRRGNQLTPADLVELARQQLQK